MRFIKYFIVCAVFILIGIIYGREIPKLKLWLIEKIQAVATEKTGFEVTAKGIGFTFLPPGIELKKISLTPLDKSTQQTVAPIFVESLEINLSAIALVTGRFEIGKVAVIQPKVDITIPKSSGDKPKESSTFELPWNDFINLPLRKALIKNADVTIRLEDTKAEYSSKNLSLSIEKSTSAAKIEIFSQQTHLKDKNGEVDLGLATRIILENQAAELSALKITIGNNLILGRGVARGEITKLQWSTLNFRTLVHLDLADTIQKTKSFTTTLKLPRAAGELNFEAIGSVKKNEPLVAAAELNAKNIQIDVYKIGDIKGKAKLSNSTITSDQIKVQNSAGAILVKDLSLNLKQDSAFATRLQTDSLYLETLLSNLGLKKPDLHLDTRLNAACEGNLSGKFRATCAGEAGGKDFRVFTETDRTIVALKDFKILSHFAVENGVMTFPDGVIQVGNSKGSANGSIDFEKGFIFNFNSDSLDFKDINSLADLNYQGSISISGVTKGNGSTAALNAHAITEDFWFEDYHLGKGNFDIAYEKGMLNISNIDMGFPNSNYNGHLSVKLSKPSTVNAEIIFPKLNLGELSNALGKVAKYQAAVDGNGSARLTAQGPLALSELSYNISGQFPSGSAYGENFQNLNINLHAIDGHVYSDGISAKKGDGLLTLTGDVTSNGIMNLMVHGQDLHINDFEHVKSLINGLDGQLKFEMSLQDKILDPSLNMSGHISQTTINQEALEDSDFSIQLYPTSTIFKSNLFADKIRLEIRQPRKIKAPSYLSFDTEQWDFSHFLSAISGSDFKRDYETNLSAHVNLSSDSGDLLESRGEIKVPSIFIRHGMYQLQNQKPVLIKFNEGLITIDSLSIKGDNTDLNISGSRSKKDNLNFNIVGNLELSLFNFLTPFFKEMRGGININAQVAGTTDKPEFLGSALLNKASFKFKEFPHGFDDINADVLFSQTKIVVNKIKGSFAGGDLTGSGTVTVKGLKDIPIDINGELNRITLNIPEGVTTKGSGNLKISGNWFPYLIQGTYNIESGLYSKNFSDQDTTFAMKRSAFLPKGILQKESSSFELDLKTLFNKGVTVRNNAIDSDVTGELEIKGDPKHVILKGEVNSAPNGKLFFRDTPFTISTGKVKFSNPTENNPNIYALATSRIRDWDINLLYQGTLDKFELKLSSSPPLPEKSIISLLALGITDDNLDKQKSSSDILALQGYQAGSVLLSQTPLIQEVKKKSGVSVRLAQSVDDTRNVVSPRFVAEKQWTPKFSTSVGRTFGDRSSQDLSAEYKLNRNFSVLGSYEQRNYDQFSVLTTTNSTSTTAVTNTQNQATDVLGINLQYQVEFK